MSNEKIGNITVDMGHGNTVGHIGHVTLQAPSLHPNTIWQNGKPVGFVETAPISTGDTHTFHKLFLDAPFDNGAEFSIHGKSFKLETSSGETSTREGGRAPKRTIWNAVCKGIR